MGFLLNPSLETIFFVVVMIGIVILLLYKNHRRTDNKGEYLQIEDLRGKGEDHLVTEIFDYYGTKILQDKGKYIVNYQGKVIVYDSWQDLPKQFQAMVIELDKRSQSKKSEDNYFMEIINGSYYITTPNGKKKRYDSYNDIPTQIRELLKR